MRNVVLICGSGGQGVMSLGVMVAQNAVENGKHATFLPVYGPEQRGGAARCTVIIDDDEIVSPLPRRCNCLVALNEVGYKKFIAELAPGGAAILNTSMVKCPVERTDVKKVCVAADETAAALGSVKAANIVMAGALIGATGIMDREGFLSSLEAKFGGKKPEVMAVNHKALAAGLSAAQS
ncbi:MAG TPA: 2-oxoacid:acceptor oxidoreductase family protein [Candidatus Acidoferrum sp.]|nr:2-oxoacid:acceptor oxidoreductase family protein [Candidatus Acidoferrum sp.]